MADSQATGEVTWSVATANQLEEIEVAVTRVDPENRAIAPFRFERALPLRVALSVFIVGSAYVHHDEGGGSLQVCHRARSSSGSWLGSKSSTLRSSHPARRSAELQQ
jgi:hypothetical protein